MDKDAVLRLTSAGPAGEELFLIVDFQWKSVSLVSVNPKTRNVEVTDTQDYRTKGP